jgi:hypothetical protein
MPNLQRASNLQRSTKGSNADVGRFSWSFSRSRGNVTFKVNAVICFRVVACASR